MPVLHIEALALGPRRQESPYPVLLTPSSWHLARITSGLICKPQHGTANLMPNTCYHAGERSAPRKPNSGCVGAADIQLKLIGVIPGYLGVYTKQPT